MRIAALLCALALATSACDRLTRPGAPALRVRNVGAVPLSALIVGFPGFQGTFGDVPAGATTDYVRAPGGVYPYAHYGFRYADSAVGQPVLDFMGATPLPGRRFTYSLAIMVRPDGRPWLELVSVTRDN